MGGECVRTNGLAEGWTIQRVGDFAAVKGGKRLPAGTALTDKRTAHPYLRIVDFRDGRIDRSNLMFVPDDVFPRISRYTISANDVWISIVGTVGLVGLVDEALDGANLTENAAKICSIASHVDKTFVSLFLRSEQGLEQIRAQTVGSTQPKLALFRIEDIRVPLPPLSEQRAIAHILGTLDDKIELNRRRNQTLEAMARALFKDWFVDFGPVRAKMETRDGQDGLVSGQRHGGRASGPTEPYLPADLWQLFPDRLDDDGKPEGWESGRLDDALILQRGFDLPASTRTHGVYPVMAASGINGYHDRHMVKGPGITTGRSGVLGRVFLVQSDFWPLNTSLWVKEFKRVSPYYAFELLRELDFEMFNAGSAVPTLNRNHVHNLPITLPTRQLIDAFDWQVTPMRKAQKKNEDECELLTQLRDTLLPKLISGELRVAEAEGFLERAERQAEHQTGQVS